MIKRIFQNFVLITFLMNSIFCFSLYGQYSKEISEPINQAGFNESAPFISLDGKHFVFVSDKDGKLLFYESTLDDDGRWGVPVPLSEINSYGGPNSVIAAPCYNYDASILYFEANYKFDSAGVDIYYSKRTSNGWSEPKSIGAPINTKAYDGQPSISSDNKTLYFVRQNLTTEIEDYKCYIIFSAELGRNAKWETPVALPMPINLECEMSPRISADNKTLYFSSFREGGKGDFDLFFAKKIAKSVWAVPNPIDTVNSIYSDNYPTITGAGDLLFYNVSRTEKKIKYSSIYNLVVLNNFKPAANALFSGKITDLFSKAPIAAKITVYNPATAQVISEFNNDPQTGLYNFVVNNGARYQIDISGEGFSHEFFDYDATSLQENAIETKNFALYSKVNLKLNVFDKEIFQPLDANIKIFDNSTNTQLSINLNKIAPGRFNLPLVLGKKYRIEFEKTHFEKNSMIFDLTGIVQFDEFERDAELTPVKRKMEINVTDEASKQGLPVEIVVTNVNKNEKFVTTVKANKDGKYVLELRDGDKYEINVSPKGYSFYSTSLDLSVDTVIEKVQVALTPLTQMTKLTFNDITFESNAAELKVSSFVELDRLVKLMKDNPEIKVEISAHTDDKGTDDYNLKLSERRAQTVVNYLVEKGVLISNLIAKGYGESKPVVANTNDETRAQNRRVEMKILEVKQQ